MNFARTTLRNPLACPTNAALASRQPSVAADRHASVRRLPLPTAAARALAVPASAPRAAIAESLVEQIGAGAMVLFFLVLVLFG